MTESLGGKTVFALRSNGFQLFFKDAIANVHYQRKKGSTIKMTLITNKNLVFRKIRERVNNCQANGRGDKQSVERITTPKCDSPKWAGGNN